MRASIPIPLSVALTLALSAGCATPIETDLDADAEDLGSIGTKEDSTSIREVVLDLAPGQVRRFRVTAHRFHAAVAQDDVGDGLDGAMLSAKNYDIEFEGDTSHDPSLEVAAPPGQDEEIRNWTLRVHNLGTGNLTGVLTIEAIIELPDDGSGSVLRETAVTVPAGAVKRFRVSGPSITASLSTAPSAMAQLSVKHYDIDVEGEPSTSPTVEAISPGDEIRNWTIRVHNLSSNTLTGHLTVQTRTGVTPPPPTGGRPTSASPVQAGNEFATYADTAPYVRTVAWDHPLIRDAMAAMGPGYRSTFSYGEWRVGYGLESTRSGTEEEIRNKKVRNFIRVLCGELRDWPDLLRQRLAVIAEHQSYASDEEVTSFDTSRNLFDQLTYPAYERMVRTMRTVHSYRESQLDHPNDGYNYGFGTHGHGSKRVQDAVPPWTHCDMKFMFSHYMVDGAPSYPDGATYEAEYETYRQTECSDVDYAWMYNFRGHVNFQPLWLESNAFNMNSRRARGAEISGRGRDYYLRPFASRYDRARAAWGSLLFYRDADHSEMIRASERNGGPIMYITDQDLDGNGLSDYRLFDEDGCGDQGVGLPIPSQNCNMVSWEEAWYTTNTTGHSSHWNPDNFTQPDMGFLDAFTTFDARMARFNAALDRHTNWGPTGYYMLDASDSDDRSTLFYGSY